LVVLIASKDKSVVDELPFCTNQDQGTFDVAEAIIPINELGYE
jgi:hypothetical protein